MSTKLSIIPVQQGGGHSDTRHVRYAKDAAAAKLLYSKACRRMLNINSWQKLAGGAGAAFLLTDAQGAAAARPPKAGDFIRIQLPGPPNPSAQGYDWVQVELVQQQTDHPFHNWLAMRVRPTEQPGHTTPETDHFFTSQATSTFMVERRGDKIIASVHGRNEQGNSHTQYWLVNLRNRLVAVASVLGMVKPQWKSLVKGIING